MAEFIVYEQSRELYEQIINRKRSDYILTTKFPIGVPIFLGEPKPDNRNLLSRLFSERDWGDVVCIGPTDRANYILAVRANLVKDLI